MRSSPTLFLLVFLAVSSATACAQTPADAPDDAPYVASVRGEVFYWVGCDAWRSLAPANLRWFESADQARQAGYRPSRARGCAGPEQTLGPDPAQTGTCTVERVVDGDTIVCSEAAERIRLLLIDAPELDQGDFGHRAREALERLLPPGTAAPIELDVQERDRYGRVLAYVFTPDGEMVNAALARQGFVVATVIPPNVRYAERIRTEVDRARESGRGLWSGSAFECTPSEHRAGTCD